MPPWRMSARQDMMKVVLLMMNYIAKREGRDGFFLFIYSGDRLIQCQQCLSAHQQ